MLWSRRSRVEGSRLADSLSVASGLRATCTLSLTSIHAYDLTAPVPVEARCSVSRCGGAGSNLASVKIETGSSTRGTRDDPFSGPVIPRLPERRETMTFGVVSPAPAEARTLRTAIWPGMGAMHYDSAGKVARGVKALASRICSQPCGREGSDWHACLDNSLPTHASRILSFHSVL
jgi:hypothetical protein